MKKIIVILIVTFTIVLTGCKSVDLSTNRTGWSDYSSIVVKDYEVIDHIFVESTQVKDVGLLQLITTVSGSDVTYNMLIKEAIALGADDIINVRIDKQVISNKSLLSLVFGLYTDTIKYTANALAIKYTKEASVETGKVDTGNPSGMASGTGISGGIMDLLQ